MTLMRSPVINNDRPAYIPECWSDDKRMDVLFNPFRIRETNPDGWDLKMNFWINLINKWCLYERRVVFTVADIRRTFERQGRLPHADCIRLVVTHMKRRGKVIPKTEEMSLLARKNVQQQSSHWMFTSFIMKPLTYGWNMLAKDHNQPQSNPDDVDLREPDRIEPFDAECQFVNRDTLDILTEMLHSFVKHSDVTCMSYPKFIRMLNQKVFTADNMPDDASLQMMLAVLESKNIIRIHTEPGGFKIVKFGQHDVSIRDVDILLVKLEMTREVLERETGRLEDKVDQLDRDARQAAQNGQKEKALILLRRKKRLENRLRDKDQQMDNLEVLYGQLLESGSKQLMLQAFQMANQVLKRESEKLEDAETIVSQLDETLNDVSNLNQEISRPVGDDNAAILELEAEAELEQMLQELEEEKEKEKSDNTNKTTPPSKDRETLSLINELDKLSVDDDLNPSEQSPKLEAVSAQ